MLDQLHENEVIELCRALVREKSYSGEEKNAAEVLKAYFEKHGFDEIQIDECGNAVGVIQGNRPGPCVVFDGHIDTVPVPDESEWSVPPFDAVERDGRIYGRGTSDMKGGVAAMACGAALFAEKTNRDFAGKIVVAGVVQEELFEGVASAYIADRYRPDFAVIAEASELNLKIGQRGRAEIAVETFGTPAHSAHPEKGVNAVYSMCRAAEALKNLPMPTHPMLKKGLLVLTDIRSDPYPGSSCVPAYCRATYDERTVTGETREAVLERINGRLADLAAEDSTFRATASYARGTGRCYTGKVIGAEKFFPAWLFSESEPYLQSCLTELRADGFSPRLTVYDFCTNGSCYAGERGIRTLGLGPSREELAHTIDEYIEIPQLTAAVSCNIAVLRALLR